jgi:cell cycle checkpoint control protein RAD9A
LAARAGADHHPVFTKALTCLSKFGEELSLAANRDGLVLSTVNSSKSAYARFSFPRDFFQSYQLTTGTAQNSQGFSQTQRVDREPKGELLVKVRSNRVPDCILQINQVLLSVFKSKTIEKLVERVELKLHDGPTESQEAEQDELESKLIVRLCCKQGTRSLDICHSIHILVRRYHQDTSSQIKRLRSVCWTTNAGSRNGEQSSYK